MKQASLANETSLDGQRDYIHFFRWFTNSALLLERKKQQIQQVQQIQPRRPRERNIIGKRSVLYKRPVLAVPHIYRVNPYLGL